MRCWKDYPTSEHVFPSPTTKGRLVDVKRRFDFAKSEAGIKDFRFHDLRHTAATRMADCGADAFTLAAIFGWSDVRMALRYTHATDEAKRRAVENLVRPIASSDESVANEKAGLLPCLKSLILLVEQRGIEPLTSALRNGLSAKT
ncbi:MAG: tyrosine-type recombinase/integrase [Acidobacteriota bacterium]